MAISNITTLAKELSSPPADITQVVPQLASDISLIITILKTVGIVLIIYIIYQIVRVFFSFKSYKKMKIMEERINKIEDRINLLTLKRKK
ncbi:MAG: hypothetical protein AABX54_03160 [Nanoarchaeota archaeon]